MGANAHTLNGNVETTKTRFKADEEKDIDTMRRLRYGVDWMIEISGFDHLFILLRSIDIHLPRGFCFLW